MLKRLLAMPLPEIACRTRQETSKRLERLGLRAHPEVRPEAVFAKLSADGTLAGVHARFRAGDFSGAAGFLGDRFFDDSRRWFFPGATSEVVPEVVRERMAEAGSRLVAAADSVCAGRFDLLGYERLSFGDPVDWRLDPISGRRAPLVHWSQIDPLDASVVGDSKVVWELNRHQWLVTLGQAYRLTGDEGYAETFVRLVREWLGANPPGVGINWTSSLELALRLISWCWALLLFRGCPALSPDFFARMLSSVWAHTTHVERHLSSYFSPNTHLTGEALGLVYVGCAFPQFRDAKRWRRLGAQILVKEIERQVLPDGVYFEQSTCYQRYTLDIYLHFLALARRNDLAVPPAVEASIGRMLDVLLAIRHPDGSLPQIGDADGGRLVSLGHRTPDDPRDVFSTASALFDRTDCAWAAGGLAPETVWLLGPVGVTGFDRLVPSEPGVTPSSRLSDGGYVVMRSGWDPKAHQLIVDVGPLGCPVSAGHGHADLLSIQCCVSGEPYLVDSGTYVYTAEPAWRDHFRSTAAHSTVMVDGESQAVSTGPFRWDARPSARLRRWRSTLDFDFADASNDAYRRLADPVVHRRRVLFVKPRYWIVVDDLDGAAEHAIDVLFQFAPMDVAVEANLWARARGHGGRGLLVRAFAAAPLKCELREGEESPIRGWVSPDYGRRQPAPVLIYSLVTCLPVRIATLLWPIEDPSLPLPAVTVLAGEGPGPVGLSLGATGEIVRFEEPEFVVERR
jgi:hypothetical protein